MPIYETQHRQKTVNSPFAGAIQVDAGMVHLLTAMWDLGLDTQFSCQGGPRREVDKYDRVHEWVDDAYVLMPYTDASIKATYLLFVNHLKILMDSEEFCRFGMQDSFEYGKRIVWKFPHTSIEIVRELLVRFHS